MSRIAKNRIAKNRTARSRTAGSRMARSRIAMNSVATTVLKSSSAAPRYGSRDNRVFAASGALLLAISGPPPAAAQQAVCGDPAGFCGRSAQSGCLERLGAGAMPVTGPNATEEDRACANELALYRDCLSLIAAQCGPPQNRGPASNNASAAQDPSAGALEMWNEIKGVDDPDVLDAFADAYPMSPLAVMARKRADALRAAAATPSGPQPPPPPSAAEQAEQAAAERAAAAEAAQLRAKFREGQRHLNRAGYHAGPEDGIWGEKSARALERFLRREGLAPSRVLTPEALALLRATPDGSARQASATTTAPAETTSPLQASLTLEFRYQNMRRDRCAVTLDVKDKALRLSKQVFSGCGRETWVRLMTEPDGSAPVSVVGYGTETIRLNGSRWRYSGRSAESGTRSLRSVTLTVGFEER